jgi:hypothetical protein
MMANKAGKLPANARWRKKLEEKEIRAALQELSLSFSEIDVDRTEKMLRKSTLVTKTFKARDILRVARLRCLTTDDKLIQLRMKKMRKGERMGPVILVQHQNKLQLADGYHRTCSLFLIDPDADVCCIKIDL